MSVKTSSQTAAGLSNSATALCGWRWKKPRRRLLKVSMANVQRSSRQEARPDVLIDRQQVIRNGLQQAHTCQRLSGGIDRWIVCHTRFNVLLERDTVCRGIT